MTDERPDYCVHKKLMILGTRHDGISEYGCLECLRIFEVKDLEKYAEWLRPLQQDMHALAREVVDALTEKG